MNDWKVWYAYTLVILQMLKSYHASCIFLLLTAKECVGKNTKIFHADLIRYLLLQRSNSLSWYTEVIQGKSQFRDPGYLAGNRIASITDTISLFHNPSIEMLHCKIQESIGMAWYNNMTVLLDSINLQGYKSQQKMSKVISTGLRR